MKKIIYGFGFVISLTLISISTSFIYQPNKTNAQVSCGDVLDYGSQTPVDNCDNPFNEDADFSYDVSTVINSQDVLEGSVIVVPATSTVDMVFVPTSVNVFDQRVKLFYHSDQDYVLVAEADNRSVSVINPLPTGTYSLVYVIDVDPPIFSEAKLSPFFKILNLFLPTAQAYFADYLKVKQVTFTIEYQAPELSEPEASNVIFLPGIQASRLYKDGLLGSEDRLWEPNGNQDVRQLSMSDAGVSDNDVYTRDILDSAYGVIGVYQSFSSFLETLVSDDVINNWAPFAYDWRYDVFDVVSGTQYEEGIKSPLDEIESLAATSKSGKVTIIGHSNGGLLAKAIMVELENQGKEDLVDKVVFLATPQTGTPKAVGTILHGYDQQQLGGLLIDDVVSRGVINNLPGAYSLIPSQKYFDDTSNLVISFDGSDTTADFRSAYGNAINNESELEDFMNGDEGRDVAQTANDAALANSDMLSNAFSNHNNLLDTWIAPAGIEVIEIVGVGLDTVSGFEYTEFKERICGEADVFGVRECNWEEFYEPIPYLSQYGDKTVIAASAEAYSGVKQTYFVDLLAIKNIQSETSVEHADIGESESVQQLVRDIITGTTTDSAFISTNRPTYANERSLLATHSPVDLRVVDNSGRETGLYKNGPYPEVKEEIPGSSWFRQGSSTYVVIPKNINYQIVIEGYDEGGVTFTKHDLVGEDQSLVTNISVATITPDTVVTINVVDDEFSNLRVDEDGDGEVDYEITLEGEILGQETGGYDALFAAIKDLPLKRNKKVLLLVKARLAEQFSDSKPRLETKMINRLEKTLKLYKRKGLITKHAAENIIAIIKNNNE